MRRLVIGAVAAGGVVAAGGIAWALLGGLVTVPQIAQGVATGGGANGCQTVPVNWQIPTPTWNATANDYVITQVSYSGVTNTCVTLGTADLIVNVVVGGQSLANGSSLNMGASTGTITLSGPVPFDDASTAQYRYLVRDN